MGSRLTKLAGKYLDGKMILEVPIHLSREAILLQISYLRQGVNQDFV